MSEANSAVTIIAPVGKVEEMLDQVLTPQEREAVKLEAFPQPIEPLSPERQGEYEVARVVLEYLATAAASGVTYDIMKKIAAAAIAKFGSKNVK